MVILLESDFKFLQKEEYLMLKSLTKLALAGSFIFTLTACGTNTTNMQLTPPPMNPVVEEDEGVIASGTHKYKIIEIQGIGDVYAKKLNDNGVKYTDEYLQFTAKRNDRLKFAEKTGISSKLLLTWANGIDLMKVKGIGPKQSNWLHAVGVDSIKELAQRRADNLHQRLELANNIDPNRKFVQRMVSQAKVQSWIDSSKTVTPTVQE